MAHRPANGRPRRPSRTAAAALSVCLGAGLLSGCGGGGGSSGPSAAGDGPETTAAPSPTIPSLPADRPQRPACDLVTQAEVEAAIGARVSPGRQQNEEGRSLCSFSLAAAADQSVTVVSASSSGVPAAFEAARRTVPDAQPVTVGDEAFVAGGQALVRKGTTMVIILLFLREERPQLASAATRLSQSAGARL